MQIHLCNTYLQIENTRVYIHSFILNYVHVCTVTFIFHFQFNYVCEFHFKSVVQYSLSILAI